jgi:hypothetical protein
VDLSACEHRLAADDEHIWVSSKSATRSVTCAPIVRPFMPGSERVSSPDLHVQLIVRAIGGRA